MQAPEKAGEIVTIVIAPREKVSTLSACLRSLFNSIPADVRVLACMPELPDQVRQSILIMMQQRGLAELIELEAGVIPHQARRKGVELANTPWVLFADNDIEFNQNWFQPMFTAMMQGKADVLAPLIFIGPPLEQKIHHAGGLLRITEENDGGITVRETHRHMNEQITKPGVAEKLSSEEYLNCDVAEFHCLAAKTNLLRAELELPAELITREQQDLALKCRKHNLHVQFIADAKVTYLAFGAFDKDDLKYHVLRWSEDRAQRSLDYMEQQWKYRFDRSRVIYRWIERHRRRPFEEKHRLIAKLPITIQKSLFKTMYDCEI